MRLEQENDDLAHELVTSKIALRKDLDNVSLTCLKGWLYWNTSPLIKWNPGILVFVVLVSVSLLWSNLLLSVLFPPFLQGSSMISLSPPYHILLSLYTQTLNAFPDIDWEAFLAILMLLQLAVAFNHYNFLNLPLRQEQISSSCTSCACWISIASCNKAQCLRSLQFHQEFLLADILFFFASPNLKKFEMMAFLAGRLSIFYTTGFP